MSKLANIQILRAVAALSVVAYHSGIETTSLCKGLNEPCSYDVWTGGYGVGLFFVISGFIMVVTSWNAFGRNGAPVDFMRRRIIRIVPLYWLITTLAVIGVMIAPSLLNVPVLDPAYIAASYVFWPMARINGLVRPIANLGWTLNLEMMFYTLFAGALFLRRGTGLAAMVITLVTFSIVQMTGVFASAGVWPSVPLNFWGDPIILNFVMGMLVAVAYKRGASVSAPQALGLITVSLVLTALAYANDGALANFPENHVVARMVNAVPPLFLFCAAALGPQVNEQRLLWSLGLLVGNASYSLYLIHPFLLRPLGKIWLRAIGDHLPPWCFLALCPIIALAAGLCCYAVVEKPLLNYFSDRERMKAIKLRANSGV